MREHALGPWLENVSSLPDLLGDGFHGAHIEGRFLRVRDMLANAKAQTEEIAADSLKKVPPPPIPPPRPQPWAETRLFSVSAARGEKEEAMLAKACDRLNADLLKLAQRVQNGKLSAPEKVAKSIGRLCERHSSVTRYYEITPNDAKLHPRPAFAPGTARSFAGTDQRRAARPAVGCAEKATQGHGD